MTARDLVAPPTIQERLEALDWECHEAETRYLTHSLHRYSGKFIPQIARQLIELLTDPGELVVDPYAGSGTTLLEAGLLGRRSLGVDLNPLAAMISSAKCTPIGRSRLLEGERALVAALGGIETTEPPNQLGLALDTEPASTPTSVSPEQDVRLTGPWFNKWFQPEVLTQLTSIYRVVSAVQDHEVRRVALLAFSDILRKSSNAHNGYPNVMFDRKAGPRALPIAPFRRRLRELVEDVCSLSDEVANTPEWCPPTVVLGDARSLPLPSQSAHAVVTHPPYIGSIPYAEYQLLSLEWLGYDSRALDASLTGGRRQSRDVVERFEAAYSQMLVECWRVLLPGRHLGLLVGDPLVRGQRVSLVEMSLRLARRAGFELAGTVVRRGVNRRANKMPDETLLVFEKVSAGLPEEPRLGQVTVREDDQVRDLHEQLHRLA